MSTNTPLTVYKASAGSGKTFTLAVEYIKLLVANPLCYRQILAVTFTNKATEEMKMRILGQLYGISRELDDSRAYTEKIAHETELAPQLIAQRAGMALTHLLHHYSYFRIQTIDTFFQSVLNNLARELDLTPNLRVELNDAQAEEKAVDEMIEELQPHDKTLRWILSYIDEHITEEKGWNVLGQIKRFGLNIFKDVYKQNEKALNAVLGDEQQFDAFRQRLITLKAESEEMLQQFAATFFDALEENGVSIADFSNGERGVCGYFCKMRKGVYDSDSLLTKTAVEGLSNPDKWVVKRLQKPGEPIFELVQHTLMPLMNYAEEQRPRLLRHHKSAVLTLRHLNQLRLLGNIERKVRALNNESNRFLLSDTQMLLHSMMHESDSPFIFEKIGGRLEHIMIDEFQDTSTVQWQNFRLLLKECMSRQNSSNLIVGDVKQSIYRWRSGDWRLLNNIEAQFNHAATALQVRNLTTNYRSARGIVTFNNAFFEAAAEVEYQALNTESETHALPLKQAYADVAQEVPAQRPAKGFVRIELLGKEDYTQVTFERTKEIIEQLLHNGAAPEEIAIIIRNNGNIQAVAGYLTQALPQVRFVSEEAFRIDASTAVNMLIAALRVLTDADNTLATAYLAKTYQSCILQVEEVNALLIAHKNDLHTLLPKRFNELRYELQGMPPTDLAEKLFALFELHRLNNESAYLCAFYDKLGEFTRNHGCDIPAFLQEWENNLCGTSIQSDEVNGVRLLTIHKSKGLEFKHVIIPFCDWQLEKSTTLWCAPGENPFNLLPLVPITFSEKQMRETVYETAYTEEHLQNTVDNLNLLYVAFTRACESLFVMGQHDKGKGYRSALFPAVLDRLSTTLPECRLEEGGEGETVKLSFEYGALQIEPSKQKKAVSQNVFNAPVTLQPIRIETFTHKASFMQSNQSAEFVADNDDEQQRRQYIRVGNVLHKIFSQIQNRNDIRQVLDRMEFEGVLYDGELTREALQEMLLKRLSTPQVAEWFSERWTVYNECAILYRDEATDTVITKRPDRVICDATQTIVIDFKFGAPKDAYTHQVRTYMELLKQMGHPNVKGFLWFVYANQIVEIS